MAGLSCSPAPAAPGTVADLTVPWSGSTINGAPEPEAASTLPEDPWLRLGAKPRTTAGPASSPVPAVAQVYAGGKVEAPVSSTPCQPELWSVACRDKHHAVPPSPPSSPPAIPLTNSVSSGGSSTLGAVSGLLLGVLSSGLLG
ncbi:protein capicua homolog [Acanthochromis polyacanthus]|uniref:protein capicua homolog n=1 Tax=Acanthochromis polyacanthus TaxID=80966 RepID=UPI0022348EC4|nr:protein capicua homolog [Acanthochromis polyacanthus]